MPSAADFAWLIPVLPLVGALITGLGLISFNRTINRLKKPVALLLISCIGAAAVISYAVLFEQLGGAPPRRASLHLGECWRLQPSDGVRRRPTCSCDARLGDNGGATGDDLFPRLHGPRQRLCALFHLSSHLQ